MVTNYVIDNDTIVTGSEFNRYSSGKAGLRYGWLLSQGGAVQLDDYLFRDGKQSPARHSQQK